MFFFFFEKEESNDIIEKDSDLNFKLNPNSRRKKKKALSFVNL